MGAPKIDPHHPFMDGAVITNMANGVVDTLRMMAEMEAEFSKPFAVPNWVSPTDLSVYLSMNSGSYRGQILFHFNKKVACSIVSKMVGEDTSLASDEEILDGVGEISNIFYGAAKAKLNAIGFNLVTSIPKPCLTKSLPTRLSQNLSVVIPFTVLTQVCYVEIVIL